MWISNNNIKHILVAAALLAGTAANAITYTGLRDLGGGNSAQISITTDGTIGTLATANITAWNITLTHNSIVSTLVPGTDGTFANVIGTALSATATTLDFNFAAATGNAFIIRTVQFPNPALVRYWCVQSESACLGGEFDGEALDGIDGFGYAYKPRDGQGLITLATASTTGGVPEPASWAMLLAGFGGIGMVLRRRRARRITA